jgi:hypothetical protein
MLLFSFHDYMPLIQHLRTGNDSPLVDSRIFWIYPSLLPSRSFPLHYLLRSTCPLIRYISQKLFSYFSASIAIYNYDFIYDDILEW